MTDLIIEFPRSAGEDIETFCKQNEYASWRIRKGATGADLAILVIETLPTTLDSIAILIATLKGKDALAQLAFILGNRAGPGELDDFVNKAI